MATFLAQLGRYGGGTSFDENIFSEDTFRKYLVPKLLEIFCVHDAQIRLLLLNHFPYYIHTFTKEELQSCILPELLVGIKDTNDHLVSVTLRTLADLVPILGATAVIGGKRAKLFNDGRPTGYKIKSRQNSTKTINHTILLPSLNVSETPTRFESSQIVNDLPERPRPDGEEEESTEEVEQSVDEELDNWDDWDVNESQLATINDNVETGTGSVDILVNNVPVVKRKSLPDIDELDIKSQSNFKHSNDEFDFFQDMEPVIKSSEKYLVDEKMGIVDDVNNKLNMSVGDDGDGWVDEEWN